MAGMTRGEEGHRKGSEGNARSGIPHGVVPKGATILDLGTAGKTLGEVTGRV